MSFIVNIKQTIPMVTQRDINRKFMYRYFVTKANQINDTIYEITHRDYNDYLNNPYLVSGYLKWVIVGKLEDITMFLYTGNPTYDRGMEPIIIPGTLTQNSASVMFLSKKIPAVVDFLRNPKQFYVGE